jgi:hypothetical protein
MYEWGMQGQIDTPSEQSGAAFEKLFGTSGLLLHQRHQAPLTKRLCVCELISKFLRNQNRRFQRLSSCRPISDVAQQLRFQQKYF